jgi:hypothetical protein
VVIPASLLWIKNKHSELLFQVEMGGFTRRPPAAAWQMGAEAAAAATTMTTTMTEEAALAGMADGFYGAPPVVKRQGWHGSPRYVAVKTPT